MKKTFDCVEMKNRLQAELLDQELRLGAEELRKRRRDWLAKGDDSLARWWRTIPAFRKSKLSNTLTVGEESPIYGSDGKEDGA